MEFSFTLIIITALGILFFGSAVWALAWATRSGKMKNFEEQAKSIFSDDEPIGTQTDFFPDKAKQILPRRSANNK